MKPVEHWRFNGGTRHINGHHLRLVCDCGHQLVDGPVHTIDITGNVVTIDGEVHLCTLNEPVVRG